MIVDMSKKNKHHYHHVDKKLQRTTVRLLQPIEGRPQTQLGDISVRRKATDRFQVLGMDIHRVEIQPDATVGLVTDAGLVVISEDDYRKMLDLQLPGGQWPRRMGRLPNPPKTELISTEEAGKLLSVSPNKILAWLRDGTLQAAGTYENEYRTTCYLLDKAVISSPATRAVLTDKIAAYQRRRDAGKQAARTRVIHQRRQHDEYLQAIAQAAPTEELRQLLTAAYLLWHLNHRAKREIGVGRTRLYAMKDRMLAALYGHYASNEHTPIDAADTTELRATFALSDADLAASSLLVHLQRTGIDTSYRPQPAILLYQVRPEPNWEYGTSRAYLSFAIRFQDFRFPFHAPLEKAVAWLPAEVRQAIDANACQWTDTDREFTFGGRPATWVEERAIPWREIEDGLAAIYQALTGQDKREFTALPPRPGSIA
jgi:hypothetical protein